MIGIYEITKKPIITESLRLHRLCWFGHVQGMERVPKEYYISRRGRPRNRLQD
jgi:hypothetical protein